MILDRITNLLYSSPQTGPRQPVSKAPRSAAASWPPARAALLLTVAGAVLAAGCATGRNPLARQKSETRVAQANGDPHSLDYDKLREEMNQRSAASFNTPAGDATQLSGTTPHTSWGRATQPFRSAVDRMAGAFKLEPKRVQAKDPTSLTFPHGKIDPQVFVQAARVYERDKNIPAARQQYAHALKADPEGLNTLVAAARFHLRQEELEQAKTLYQRAAQAHPENAVPHNDWGLACARQQDYPAAITALQTAVKLDGENPRYRNNLAKVYVFAGQPAEALHQLAAGAAPNAEAYVNLAALQQLAGDAPGMHQSLAHATRLDPQLVQQLQSASNVQVAQRADVPTTIARDGVLPAPPAGQPQPGTQPPVGTQPPAETQPPADAAGVQGSETIPEIQLPSSVEGIDSQLQYDGSIYGG